MPSSSSEWRAVQLRSLHLALQLSCRQLSAWQLASQLSCRWIDSVQQDLMCGSSDRRLTRARGWHLRLQQMLSLFAEASRDIGTACCWGLWCDRSGVVWDGVGRDGEEGIF